MKIGINGFGRIGRSVLKIALERDGFEVAGINELSEAATMAHLLKHDSNYGIYKRNVQAQESAILVDQVSIPVFSEKNPGKIPWGDLGVDVVIEATGLFPFSRGEAGGYLDHIQGGASKVILTAPGKDDIPTVILGVNDEIIDSAVPAWSIACSTSNCLAPLLKVLHQRFKVNKGLMTAVHAYTNEQVLLDGPHSDLRHSRAAGLNIIPAGSAAAGIAEKVLPDLKGRIKGMAMRVPVPVGSVVDLNVLLEEDCSAADLNQAMKEASRGELKGILQYSEAPLVSSDLRGNPHSAVFDSSCTMKISHGFFKMLAWYDNEMAYATRFVDLAQKLI